MVRCCMIGAMATATAYPDIHEAVDTLRPEQAATLRVFLTRIRANTTRPAQMPQQPSLAERLADNRPEADFDWEPARIPMIATPVQF